MADKLTIKQGCLANCYIILFKLIARYPNKTIGQIIDEAIKRYYSKLDIADCDDSILLDCLINHHKNPPPASYEIKIDLTR